MIRYTNLAVDVQILVEQCSKLDLPQIRRASTIISDVTLEYLLDSHRRIGRNAVTMRVESNPLGSALQACPPVTATRSDCLATLFASQDTDSGRLHRRGDTLAPKLRAGKGNPAGSTHHPFGLAHIPRLPSLK